MWYNIVHPFIYTEQQKKRRDFNPFASGILYFSGPPCGIMFSENSKKNSSH